MRSGHFVCSGDGTKSGLFTLIGQQGVLTRPMPILFMTRPTLNRARPLVPLFAALLCGAMRAGGLSRAELRQPASKRRYPTDKPSCPLARMSDPSLAVGLTRTALSPNSMSIALAPVTVQPEIAQARDFCVNRRRPLTHEAFANWVDPKDEFCAGRPRLENKGWAQPFFGRRSMLMRK